MISFRHGEKTVNLPAGDLWAAGTVEETYRDTSAEELWSIVHEVEKGTPWREAVARRYAQSNSWLHRVVTSPDRDLFFRLHPPQAGARVLDVGAGWGQIALPLARTCEVTALEPTPERLAFIRAAAAQEGATRRLHFVQADLFDVEFDTKFDLVTCIGVLEWVPKFRAGDPRVVQIDFLRCARALLAPGGRLVVGIENRLGLKYLLGAPDDHLGVPNIAVYDAGLASRKWQTHSGGALRVFTFTRVELAEMLSAAGLSDHRFFAALPDYKLPQRILPLGSEVDHFFQQGGYVAEHDGSGGQPLSCQAELCSHYQSLAQLGIASDFVPSFYVSCQRTGD
jgi:2-polyprenyl-3-methyl-5-hydroxy-6-metoxy-1,4-benzoquinol methylase